MHEATATDMATATAGQVSGVRALTPQREWPHRERVSSAGSGVLEEEAPGVELRLGKHKRAEWGSGEQKGSLGGTSLATANGWPCRPLWP